MASNKIGIDVVINVMDKNAQSRINKLQAGLATFAGQTHQIKLGILGDKEAEKELQDLIAKFQQLRKISGQKIDLIDLNSVKSALALVDKELSTATGRTKRNLEDIQSAFNRYLVLTQSMVDRTQAKRGVTRTILGEDERSKFYNDRRNTDLRNIDTNLAIARQNGDLKEQLSLLKQKQKILEKIDRSNRATTDSPELVKTRQEIAALKQKVAVQRQSNAEMAKQSTLLGGLTNLAYRYLSVFTVARVVENMAKTVGYFQQQQVALEGILGSATKAKKALDEIKELALESPFQTKELVRYTKQLSAYGIDSEKLVGTMKSLADISAGLGVDMGRIILAYGQVKSAAVLRGQELRQFTEAGIPMVEALSKKLTEVNGKLVTTGEVFKYISERKVPFEMVASVLSDMTAEGGKFYRMQENLTNTLYGQIEKLKDVWTLALNDVGSSLNSIFRSIVSFFSTILKNIQSIAIGITAAFSGTIIRNFAMSIAAMRANMASIVADFHRLNVAARAARIAILNASNATERWAIRMRSLGAVVKSIGSFFTSGLGMIAIGAVSMVIANAVQRARELDKALREINATYSKETSKMITGFDTLVNKLHSAAEGSKDYNNALSTLKNNYGDFVNDDMVEILAKQKDGWEDVANSVRNTIREVQNYNAAMERAGQALSHALSGYQDPNFWRQLFGATLEKTTSNIKSTLFYTPLAQLNSARGLSGADAITQADIDNFVENTETINELMGIALENFKNNKGTSLEDLKQEISSLTMDAGLKKILNAFASSYFSFISSGEGWRKYITNLQQAESSPLNVIQKNLEEAIKRAGEYNEGLFRGDKESAEYLKNYAPGYNPMSWTINKQNELISATIKSVAEIFGADAAMTISKKLAEFNVKDSNRPYAMVKALDDLKKTLSDERLVTIISNLTNEYKKLAQVETGRTVQVNNLIRNVLGSSVATAEMKDFYARYLASDSNYESLVKKVRSDRADAQKYLKENKRSSGAQREMYEQVEREKVWLDDLFSRIYALNDDSKKSGAGAGGGWRRMFSDLFNYIKEAREEEKKLVEGTAGLTGELRNQINSGQLSETAVRAFWSEGSPFQRIINKIEEYGIESDVFNKDFLKNALESITTKSLDETGIIDYKDVWNQLLKIISDRAEKLDKKTRDSLKAYLQQMTVEGEKYFGRQAVEDLLRTQLGEMKRINANVEAIRNSNSMFENIAGNSNYLIAQRAIYGGGPYSRYDRVGVTANQLRTSLGASYGLGFASTGPGTALKRILDSGSLNIYNLAELASIRSQMAAMTASDFGEGEDAVKRFDEFKASLGNFDNLIKQLSEDISGEFSELMKLNDGVTSRANKFTNAARNYVDAIDRITKAVNSGIISKAEADRMRIAAMQNAFKETGGATEEWINEMYGANGASGLSSFGKAMANMGVSFETLMKNSIAEQLRTDQEEAMSKLNSGEYTQEQFDSKMSELSENASSAMSTATGTMASIDKIIRMVYGAIKGIIELGESIIKTEKATNHSLMLGVQKYNENGQLLMSDYYYQQEKQWEKAEEAFNVVSTYNQHVMDGWEKFKSGDYVGAVIEVFTSIMDLISGIAGIGDSDLRRQQDDLVRSNESLERAMRGLEHELNNLAGIDRFANLTDQIANLRQQEQNYNQLLNLENQKKSADAEKAQDLADNAVEAARQAEDIVRSIREEIFGTADELASQLTDPLVEAFRNGENAARAWRDAVRGYIGDVLKEILLTKVIAPRINSILKNFGINEDTTSPEDILALFSDPTKAVGLRNALFAEGTWLEDVFNNLPKPIQEMIAWNSDTSALSGGIQGITEDTARTLEGLSNSMLAQLVLINRSLSWMEGSGIAQVQVSWFNDMINQQRAIRQATEGMNNAISEMRNGIRPLVVQMQ